MRARRVIHTLRCVPYALVIFVGIITASAQTPAAQTADVQQLSEKLQRLEREMEELKGQLSAVQQSDKDKTGVIAAPQVQVSQDTPKAPVERPPAEEATKSTLD